jgi:hypothetical protein
MFNINSDNTGPFLDDPGSPQTMNLNISPVDEQGDSLSTPGVLLDSTFTQIGSISLSVDTDTTPTAPTALNPQTLNPNPDLSFGPATYVFNGAFSEANITFTATEVATGGPLVPSFYSQGSLAATQSGTLAITMTPTALQWTNPSGYPSLASDPLTNMGTIALPTPQTTATAQFPLATNAGTYTFGLVDTSTTFGGTIALSAVGCGVVTSLYAPALGPSVSYASLSSGSYFQITMGSAGATNSCVITASDGTNTATLSLYTDQSSIVISGKARKH